MFKSVILFVAVVSTAKAGFLGPAVGLTYSPAPSVSHVTYAAASPAHVTYAAAPAAYSYGGSPLAVHAPAIGASHESTLRSLDGNSAVSHYSKAVDTAFSSVRKYDTRYTNDAKLISAAPAYAYAAAPTYAYGAPIVAKTAYAAPTYAYSAPIVAKTAYAAPTYAYSAPIVAKTAYAAPTYAYSAPAVVAKTAYAAPTYSYGAPIVAKTAYAAPVAYSPAGVVAHTTFSGLGASYAW